MADKNIVKHQARDRRKRHIRKKIAGSAVRPRLVVFRSLKHIYAQIVDDDAQVTIASVTSNSKSAAEFLGDAKSKTDAAFKAGHKIGELAKEKGIEKVVFDRNGYIYHGRVKALADGARKAGLSF